MMKFKNEKGSIFDLKDTISSLDFALVLAVIIFVNIALYLIGSAFVIVILNELVNTAIINLNFKNVILMSLLLFIVRHI